MTYLSDIQRLVLVIFVTILAVQYIVALRRRRVSLVWTGGTAIIPILAIALVLLLPLNFYFEGRYAFELFFAATFILGVLIMFWAEKHLGENHDDFWKARHSAKERSLVTTGPYVHIRHPMYAGLALIYLSLMFLFFNPITIALTALYVAVLVFTAIAEERFLHENLPGYPDYAKKIGRFLPKMRK